MTQTARPAPPRGLAQLPSQTCPDWPAFTAASYKPTA